MLSVCLYFFRSMSIKCNNPNIMCYSSLLYFSAKYLFCDWIIVVVVMFYSDYMPFLSVCSEWLVNQHRDSVASYIGHYNLLDYFAVAENESKARVQFNLLEVNCIHFYNYMGLSGKKLSKEQVQLVRFFIFPLWFLLAKNCFKMKWGVTFKRPFSLINIYESRIVKHLFKPKKSWNCTVGFGNLGLGLVERIRSLYTDFWIFFIIQLKIFVWQFEVCN